MRMPARLVIFGLGTLGIGGMFAASIVRLPGPDELHSPLGTAINARVVSERHCTDAVTAVNFDYRGFDTLGEEFILFVAVMGAMVLLRQVEEKVEPAICDAVTPEREARPSETVRVWTMFLVAPTVVFGIYIVVHGQLTPGGGFQGGVILAVVPLLIYVSESLQTFQRVTSFLLLEVAEAVGAAAYAIIGLLGLISGDVYLTNVLPLGEVGSVLSGGMVPCISLATGLEVTAAFVLLSYAFLQETMENNR